MKKKIAILILLFLTFGIFTGISRANNTNKTANDQEIQKIKESAEKGDSDAQLKFGLMYSLGDGVKQDKKEAEKWLKKSAEKNYFAEAYLFILHQVQMELDDNNANIMDYTDYYNYKIEITKEDIDNINTYKKLAKQSKREWDYTNNNQIKLGLILISKIEAQQENFEYLKKLAKQGNSNAQAELGLILTFINFKNSDKNNQEAIEYLNKSAKQNNSYGQVYLGFAYLNGYGVNKDREKALKYFKESAENGNSIGQGYTALMYLIEIGYHNSPKCTKTTSEKEIDRMESMKYAKKSAEQNNSIGQYVLGKLLMNKIPNEAMELLKRSEQQKNIYAMKWFYNDYLDKNLKEVLKEINKWKIIGFIILVIICGIPIFICIKSLFKEFKENSKTKI